MVSILRYGNKFKRYWNGNNTAEIAAFAERTKAEAMIEHSAKVLSSRCALLCRRDGPSQTFAHIMLSSCNSRTFFVSSSLRDWGGRCGTILETFYHKFPDGKIFWNIHKRNPLIMRTTTTASAAEENWNWWKKNATEQRKVLLCLRGEPSKHFQIYSFLAFGFSQQWKMCKYYSCSSHQHTRQPNRQCQLTSSTMTE